MEKLTTKTAFIAIVGKANVGKSTLINRLIGEKIAITSALPQTTRNRITGVITKEETQLIFLDTPGWHRSQSKLGDYMISQINDSLAGVELALLVTDSTGSPTSDELELIETLKLRRIPAFLLLNKIDLLKQKELMMPKITAFTKLFDFKEVVPISAQKGDGVDQLLPMLMDYAKPSPHFFDDDDFTDQPERNIVSEIVREKLLRNLREELPHGIAVGVENMKEREGKPIIDIDVTIFCEKNSHKGMIIGKNGAMLKKVASEARRDIERFLDIQVNLRCWVKVKEDWRNRENLMKQFGFN